jgi:histidinol-phosphate aminotransferase
MQDTYSVSSVAQAAALAALDDEEHVTRSVSHNAEQAQRLEVDLSNLGFRVVPTWANFLYCDLRQDAAAVCARLREEGVSVRPLGAWGAPTCIRVSIGTSQHNVQFLEAMRRILAPTSSQGG